MKMSFVFDFRKSSLIGLCLVHGGLSGAAAGGQVADPVDSVYRESQGAGVLRFGYEGDQSGSTIEHVLGYIFEVRDINGDGLPDLISRRDFLDAGIQYALGELRENGALGFRGYTMLHSYGFDAGTAGDFDGNGWADLITINYGDSYYQIHWVEDGSIVKSTEEGDADLGYGEDFFNEYADSRITVRSGDLDGDGKDDLVFNTTEQRIVVRWSSREGASMLDSYPAAALASGTVLYPLADYDGDSDLDVLTLDRDSEQFVLFEGTGTDALGTARVIGVSASGHVLDGSFPVFGQFDDDPAVDMVLFDVPSQESVLISNFAGDTPVASALGLGGEVRVECVPGDVDGSGYDDLLITGFDRLSVTADLMQEKWLLFDPMSEVLTGGAELLQIETGNTPPVSTSAFDPDIERTVACITADVNGDELNDLLWMGDVQYHKTHDLEFTYLQLASTLRVTPARSEQSGLPRFGASQYLGHKDPLHMLPVDLDSDGADEIFAVGINRRGVVIDFENPEPEPVSGVNGAWMSAAADLGGDGMVSIVSTNVMDRLVITPVMADGTLEDPNVLFHPTGGAYHSVVAGDLNGDGKDDLVAFDYTGREMHVYVGTAHGMAVFSSSFAVQSSRMTKACLLDMDLDGDLDLLLDSSGLGFTAMMNSGDGTFGSSELIPMPVQPYWIIAADMNQDGIDDIVSANVASGQLENGISVHYRDATGVIDQSVILQGPRFGRYSPEVVAADMNNDGLFDLVASSRYEFGGSVENQGRNSHHVWEQKADGTFECVAVLPAPDSVTIAVSDVNLDGAIDVITASDLDESVRVHWGTPAACAADLTGEGDLNFLDISEFLNVQLDFNGDGGFNFLDISAYLQAFSAGCP